MNVALRICGLLALGLASALLTGTARAFTFTQASTFTLGGFKGSGPAIIADVNSDGRPDLILNIQRGTRPSPGGFMAIAPGLSPPGTLGTAVASCGGSTFVPGLAVADFNGDGKPDFVIAQIFDYTLTVCLGTGTGTLVASTRTIPIGIARGVDQVVAGDFNRDGKLDLAVGGAGSVSILLGNGDGTFSDRQVLPGAGSYLQAVDVDRDGILDLVAIGSENGMLRAFRGQGDGTFAAFGSGVQLSEFTRSLDVADFNGDGIPDVAVATDSPSPGRVSIFLGSGNGNFVLATSLPKGAGRALLGDLDRDGRMDIVVAQADGTIGIYRGNGDGTFATAFTAAAVGSPMAVGDIDGDGRPDIVAIAAGSPPADSNVFGIVYLNTTPVPPNPPTSVTAVPGNGRLTVAFAPPADAASLPIIEYTATCGTTSVASASAPIIVTGLANGLTYTCTVRARNATGTSAASTPATGTPVPPALTTFTSPTATGSGAATASFTGGGAACSFTLAQFIPLAGHVNSPPAGGAPAQFPHGLFDFTLSFCTPGSAVVMTIVYPSALPTGTQYWKFGPEPGRTAPHWYVLPATITGSTVVFTITDGGQGDDDLAANGTVIDQGGPGVPGGGGAATNIPTLSEWAMALLASLLLLAGLRREARGRV